MSTASSNRYQKNDNIFVNIGKESHPAIFLEYDKNENDNKAKIRFTASSVIATVQLNQLELMETTTKRRRTTPKQTLNDTPVTIPSVAKKGCAKQFAPPNPTHAVTVANVTAKNQHIPTVSKCAAANTTVHNATDASPLLTTTFSHTEHPHTTVTTNTTIGTLMSDITTPSNNFSTYNGGRYRLSNASKQYNRWICNKFKMEHKGDKPTNNYYDQSDIQKMKRDKSTYIAEDWTFIRCSGTFNVHLNGKIEFVTPHDCYSTFQIQDAIDERPMITSMIPSTKLGLSTTESRNQIRKAIMNTRGIWKPLFERYHTPNLMMEFPHLHDIVKQNMSWYVTRVQKLYPSLIYVKYNIILSFNTAPDQTLQFDYNNRVMNKDPERQPISLIVAIDPFSLNIVKEREGNNTTTIVEHIEEGNCIILTNNVAYGARRNEFEWDGLRLFAYMVSDEKDFPSDTVQYLNNIFGGI